MNQEKYIGVDVHQATISVAVVNSSGKLIMECILETKAATILEFLRGDLIHTLLRGWLPQWLLCAVRAESKAMYEHGTSHTRICDMLKQLGYCRRTRIRIYR